LAGESEGKDKKGIFPCFPGPFGFFIKRMGDGHCAGFLIQDEKSSRCLFQAIGRCQAALKERDVPLLVDHPQAIVFSEGEQWGGEARRHPASTAGRRPDLIEINRPLGRKMTESIEPGSIGQLQDAKGQAE